MKIEYLAIGALLLTAAWCFWKMQKWKLLCFLAQEKLDFACKGREDLKETFKALSQDALESNHTQFLHLAQSKLENLQEKASFDLEKRQHSIQELLHPMKEGLGKLEQGLQKLEKERQTDHVELKTQVSLLLEAKHHLAKETMNLAKALRSPNTRGRWGELQLRRVVEIAGMLNHCDFYEQVRSEEVRPDLVVRLAGGRQIIVDAKVPLEAYLEALEVEQESQKEEKLQLHAKHLRSHIAALGKKSYHQSFLQTPEFVVLFLPSESFFSAALQYDPSLIECGADLGVILSTPSTLIALLRSVAYGWKQENLSLHVQKVSVLGQELYKRLIDMVEHFSKTGKSLASAVDSFNKTVGSLESRVLVTARKFNDLGAASSQELDVLEPIEKVPRLVIQDEL